MIRKNSNAVAKSNSNGKSRSFGSGTGQDVNVNPLNLGTPPAKAGTTVEIPGYVDSGVRQLGVFLRDTASTALGVAGGNRLGRIWDK